MARHHPETDFSLILNSDRPPTRDPNSISNSHNIQSNANVHEHNQQLNAVQFEMNNPHILNPNVNTTQPDASAQTVTKSRKSRKTKSNRKSKRRDDTSNDIESDSNSDQRSFEIDEASVMDPASLSEPNFCNLERIHQSPSLNQPRAYLQNHSAIDTTASSISPTDSPHLSPANLPATRNDSKRIFSSSILPDVN